MAPNVDGQPARLRAHDLDDLSVIGTLIQDSLVPAQDIQYLPDDKSFVLALNRFRWETAEAGPPFERVHSGLRFDKVEQVRYRGIDRSDDERFYDLLAVAYDRPDSAADGAGHVMLQFADGAAIRLTVSGLDCWLQDFGDPWPSPNRPEHTE